MSLVGKGEWDSKSIKENQNLQQSVREGSSWCDVDLGSKEDYDIILPGSTSIGVHTFFPYYIMKVNDVLEAVTKIRETPIPYCTGEEGKYFCWCPTRGGTGTQTWALSFSKCQTTHPENTQSRHTWVKCKRLCECHCIFKHSWERKALQSGYFHFHQVLWDPGSWTVRGLFFKTKPFFRRTQPRPS